MSRASEQHKQLNLAIVISLVLHILAIGLLIWSSLDEHINVSASGDNGSVIDAVMVDPNQVVQQYNQQQQAAEKAAAEQAAAEKAAAEQAAAEKAAAEQAAAEKAAAEQAAAEKAAAEQAAAEKAAAEKAAAEKAAAEKAAAEKAAAEKAAAEKAAAEKAAAEKAAAEKAAAEKAAAEKAAAEKAAAEKAAAEKAAAEKAAAEKAAAEKAAAEKAAAEKAAAEKKQAADVSDLLGSLSSGKNAPKAAAPGSASRGATNSEINAYTNQIKSAIESKFYDYKAYEGRTCSLRIKLARDGLLLDIKPEGGDPALCQAAMSAARQANMPKPPSDAVYERVNNAILDFKPGG